MPFRLEHEIIKASRIRTHPNQNFLRSSTFRTFRSFPRSASTGGHYPATSRSYSHLHGSAQTKETKRTFSSDSTEMASATSFYDFKPIDKKGEPFPLSELKGKVVLVVNTASKCGFTPQFEGLEKLYKDLKEKHGDKFTILGFPCNQFGSQDPGSNDEIQSFCQVNYGVTFPVLGKVDVNGSKADPTWEWMKASKPGLMGLKMIKWNFEKFLIGADGTVKGRWASTTKPETLKDVIEKELATLEKPVA